MAIDVVFGVALLYGFYLGFSRGIIKTIFTVISIIFGIMAAFKFAPATTQFLTTAFNDDSPLWFLVGIIVTFVAIMMLIRLFARGLEGILETININIINQLAGGMLLAGVSILLYSYLIWFADSARLIDNATKRSSQTYAYLEKFPDIVKETAYQFRPIFEDFWDHSMDMMDQLEEMSIEREENESIYDIEEEN